MTIGLDAEVTVLFEMADQQNKFGAQVDFRIGANLRLEWTSFLIDGSRRFQPWISVGIFKPVGREKDLSLENAADKITSISQPFLEFSIVD